MSASHPVRALVEETVRTVAVADIEVLPWRARLAAAPSCTASRPVSTSIVRTFRAN